MSWFDILKIERIQIWEYWFTGKEGNSIIVTIPYSGFLPDEKGQIEYAENFWVKNHERFKDSIGDKFVGTDDNYKEIREPFSLTLIDTEIIDTSENKQFFGLKRRSGEVGVQEENQKRGVTRLDPKLWVKDEEPAEVKLDNWLRLSYTYNILIDLDEKILLDRIREDDETAKIR